MHVTLLLPGLLVPHEIGADLARSVAGSALTTRLAGARKVGERSAAAFALRAAHLDWIAREIFHRDAAPPTAPYAYAELSRQFLEEELWHADPIHIELGRDHLFIQQLASAPSESEAAALMGLANVQLSIVGAELKLGNSQWFLRTEPAWEISTLPLAGADLQRLDTVLPTGADTHIWMRVHNEIQMSWHEHPVNEAREQRGDATINGLWLHGGGRWRSLAPIAYTEVAAADPALRGAAIAAGATANASLDGSPVDRALLVWDDAFDAHQHEDWGTWLRVVADLGQRVAALAASTAIDLVLTGGTTIRTFRSQRSDALRFWQRADLASMLAEPR